MNGAVMRNGILVCAALLAAAPSLWPQQNANRNDDIASIIGLRLEDLFLRFGVPKSVHAERGDEIWQDDVVFVYNEGDFYIYSERVWQIRVHAGYGLKIGDPKAAVLLALADKALDKGDYLLYPITGGVLPLSMRVDFYEGRISGICVYRTDY
jgi:hypothetical protein